MKIALGTFELYKPIGKGGMGEVWEGLHVPQQMPVAIKVVTDSEARRDVYFDSFRTEIRAVAQLDHPGIVAVLDYGEVPAGSAKNSGGALIEGSPYIVMELAKRGSLLKFQEQIGWNETKLVLFTVLDALAHAHASGLIHRDLKPANILIGCGDSSRAGIKLTDFGLAHTIEAIEDDERNGWGTPQYMAPEQFRGAWREYGPWTDLYALGVMAYQMVTGQYPFVGNSRVGIAQAHIVSMPAALAPRFEIPDGFEGWLSRLLQKSPLDRFRTAADAAWALRSLGDPPGTDEKRSTVSIMSVGFESKAGSTVVPSSETAPPGLRDLHNAPTIFDRAPTTELLSDEKTGSGTLSMRAVESDAEFAEPMEAIKPPLPWTWRRPAARSYTRSLLGAGLGLFGLRSVRMVGREAERDAMWDVLKEVRSESVSRCILLRGDAGTGKSRLAEWISQRADEVGSAVQVRARFSPLARSADAISESLQHLFRVVGCEQSEKEERVVKRLEQIGIRNQLEIDSYLNAFFREKSDVSVELRFALFSRVLKLVTMERPVVFWLDDVQWGEDGVRLAKYIVDHVPDSPVFVVATVRGDLVGENPRVVEALNELHQHGHCTLLDVEPLDETDTNSLVRDLLHLEPTLATEVTYRSGGSPLFAVQLVGDWVQRGFLKFGRDGFQLKAGIHPSIPDDIHMLWTKRIELLLEHSHTSDQTALELAAALGNSVSLSEWTGACDLAGLPSPEELLRKLVAGGFAVYRRDRWDFCHGMLRESIERSAREQGTWSSINATCVKLLQQMYPKRSWPFHERFANHLIEGDAPVEALESILVAARTRGRRGEFGLAHRWLDRHRDICAAIHFNQEDVRISERWICRAELLNAQGKHQDAIPYAQQAQVESRRKGWREVRRNAMLQEGRAQLFVGHLDLAKRLFVRGREMMQAAGDVDSEAACTYGLARVCEYSGELDDALTFLKAAMEGFESVNDQHGVAECYNALGDVCRAKGDYAQAHTWVEQALVAYRAMSNPIGVADSINDQSVLYRLEGQFSDARAACETALKMYESVGAGQAMFVKMHLGWILTHQEKHGEARQMFDESRVYFHEQNQVGLCGECSVLSLQSLIALGETVLVKRRAEDAARMLERSGWRSPEIDDAVAKLRERHGDREELESLFSALD